jgi:Skp family chaperone for outer membrane proteins
MRVSLMVPALLAGLLCTVVSVPAVAQSLPQPKIAVVDVQAIMSEAKSSQGVMAQRTKMAESYQQEFAAEETKLREEEQALVAQRNVLSPEVFAEKRKAFEAKGNDFARRAAQRRHNLDQAYNLAMSQIVTQLNNALREISNELGANLVLSRSQVEYFDPSMDITKKALDKLNISVKEVIFPDPTKMGDGTGKEKAADKKAPAAKDKDAAKDKKK